MSRAREDRAASSPGPDDAPAPDGGSDLRRRAMMKRARDRKKAAAGDARPEPETQTTRLGGETLADSKLESKHETHERRGAGVKTDVTSTQTASLDKTGLHGKHGHREETRKGEVSVADEKQYGVDAGKDGVKAAREHTTEAAVGDHKKTSTRGQSLAVDGQGLEVGLTGKHRDEIAGQASERQQGISAGAGPDGARGRFESSSTGADGTQRAGSLSGEIGAHHVEVAGELSTQSKDGPKASIGGNVKFGKDGAELGADASYGKAKLSASGGIHVEADDPIALAGGKFLVSYKVTGKLAGSAGYKGATFGASLGGSESEFQTGSREFDSFEAAEEFQKNAASQLEDGDPESADSVLAMKIGESRGEGTESGWNAGGSGGMDGASVELSGGAQHSNGVSVERVSEDEAEVTVYKASGSAEGLGAGGLGFAQSSGSDSAEEESITVRFNLKDPEARSEFERYAHHPDFFPKYGKLVGSAGFESGTGTEGTSFSPLGSAGYTSKHSKSEVSDQNGSRSSYVGEANEDAVASANLEEEMEAHQLGISEDEYEKRLGHEEHSDWRMSAQMENASYKDEFDYGDRAEFQIEGKVGGDSGKDNWQHLYEMTHASTEDIKAEDAGDIQSSGSWKLSAGLRATDMEGFAISVMNDQYLTAGPRYELQQELRQAADEKGGLIPEDMIRIVTEYFSAQGPDALDDMRKEIYGNKIESLDRSEALQWDVELEGDKNFPGVPGRQALEKKQEDYTAALTDPARHGAVAASASEDLKALRERREAVADPTRYRDLPLGLKRRELEKIDANIEKLQTLRHQAAVSQTEQQDDAEEPKDPKMAELHQLRKQIIGLDREIKELPQNAAGKGLEQASDEFRQEFLTAKDPETALALGRLLLAHLEIVKADLQAS